jgi:hypothetical protein
MKTLLTAIALVVGTVAAAGSALAHTDSPFYPQNFTNPNPPVPVVGAGSGIPLPYRLGQ